MPTRGASAAREPAAPTAEKMFEASDTSVAVEIGGTANVAPTNRNGPWKPNASRTSHSIKSTTGTAATSAGVARTVASPRVIDVRILGIGTALGPRGAKIESSSPLRGAGSGSPARGTTRSVDAAASSGGCSRHSPIRSGPRRLPRYQDRRRRRRGYPRAPGPAVRGARQEPTREHRGPRPARSRR